MVYISNQPPLCTQVEDVTSQPCRAWKKRFGYGNRKVLEGAIRFLSASSPSSTSQSERRTIDRPAPPAPAYTPYKFNGPTTFSLLKRQETLKRQEVTNHGQRLTMTANYESEPGLRVRLFTQCKFSSAVTVTQIITLTFKIVYDNLEEA